MISHTYLVRRRVFALSILAVLLSSGARAEVTVNASRSKVRIVRHPLVRTSEELIDAAQAAGRIDPEKALVYKVFAAMGDCRLPAEFVGNAPPLSDTDVLLDASSRLGSLSPETQRLLAPFLMRPGAHGSWAELETNCVNRSLADHVGVRADIPLQWTLLGIGKVIVHYQTRFAEDAALASRIEIEANTIWSKLTGLFGGREPLGDKTFLPGEDRGDDDRLDIYVSPLLNFGGSHSNLEPGFLHPSACSEAAAFIWLNASLPFDVLKHHLAFLLTKAIIRSYKGNTCGEYKWLGRATATFAVHYVYPESFQLYRTTQFFVDPASDFLTNAHLPLETVDGAHEYGAYLFLFYLEKGLGDVTLIRQFWENSAQADSLVDVGNVLAPHGGLAAVWPKFVRYNWNQEPVDDYHRWDPLPAPFSLTARDSGEKPDVAKDAFSDEEIFRPDGPLRHLSAQYFRIRPIVSDRSFLLLNGWTYNAEKNVVVRDEFSALAYTAIALDPKPDTIRVEALAKIRGQWRQYVGSNDWTNKPFVTYCGDRADEQIEEVVIIVSNSEFHDRNAEFNPSQLPFVLFSSNISCNEWNGSAKSVLTWIAGGVTTENVDNLKWSRASSEADTMPYYSGSAILGFSFVPQGTIDWNTTTPGECSVTPTSGSFDAATNKATMQIYSFLPIGSTLYRKYTGKGTGPQHPSTLTCRGVAAPSPIIAPWLLLLDANSKLVDVEPDGGELTGKGGRFPLEFFWQFTAAPPQ